MRSKIKNISLLLSELVDAILPLTHCYQNSGSVDSDVNFSSETFTRVCDLAWSDEIQENERLGVNRHSALLTSLNGNRAEIVRWMALALVLERSPEYINIRVMLEIASENQPTVRFMTWLCGYP